MFSLALFIGIYSYLIFALGLMGVLYKPIVILVTIGYVVGICVYYQRQLLVLLTQSKELLRTSHTCSFSRFIDSGRAGIKNNKSIAVCWGLLILLSTVNVIGALGPELGFDALWYHLTLPTLYLTHHLVSYIPGGLLYYSAMPQLTEMLYIAALSFGNEILAKLVHFSFGILVTIALYKLARNFLDKKTSFIACVIFCSNLVFSWESITAYIDLARTFFEIMALWGFIIWRNTRDKKWLLESGALLGLAISTKLLSLGSVFIYIILLVVCSLGMNNTQLKKTMSHILWFLFFVGIACGAWLINAYNATGNPLYPLFTNYEIHQTALMVLNPLRFLVSLWTLFTHAADPVSPIYILILPVLGFLFIKSRMNLGPSLVVASTARSKDSGMTGEKIGVRILYLYSILALIVWYITPQTGGGRFILPYLPAFSILAASVFRYRYSEWLKKLLFGLVFLIAIITIGYRGIANAKYLPVIIGRESKAEFLTTHLNFSYGDFYDTDGYFAQHITSSDTVLTYGMHNVYYANFPFIDSSWVKKGDTFNYILVQGRTIPKRFDFWRPVYRNPITKVTVYSVGGQRWYY